MGRIAELQHTISLVSKQVVLLEEQLEAATDKSDKARLDVALIELRQQLKDHQFSLKAALDKKTRLERELAAKRTQLEENASDFSLMPAQRTALA
ncbi:MAG: hypothetical protein AB7G75_29895, partial [Candidatus Binatia bacterium]